MRNPPREVVMTWPKYNPINPETQGNTIHIVAIAMITLSALVVMARIYVRWRILHNMGTDDWLILVALIPGIGLTVSTLMGTRFGWGLHIWDNHPKWIGSSLLTSWISQLLFMLTVFATKLSICWSYRRLSKDNTFNRVLLGTQYFIATWGIIFICTTIFKCWPIHTYWTDLAGREQACSNEKGPLLTASISNLATDFWITCLPMPVLWRLQLPFRQRLVLMILMSLGLVACAAGIARVYYLDRTLLRTYDVTWEGYNIWLWTAVEVDLRIICSSVPPLRPLIRRHFPRMLETNQSFGIATTLPGDELPDRDDPERAKRIVSDVLASPRKSPFTNPNEFYFDEERKHAISIPQTPRSPGLRSPGDYTEAKQVPQSPTYLTRVGSRDSDHHTVSYLSDLRELPQSPGYLSNRISPVYIPPRGPGYQRANRYS